MTSISSSTPLQLQFVSRTRPSLSSLQAPSSLTVHRRSHSVLRRCAIAVKTSSEDCCARNAQDALSSELLRKPVATSVESAGEGESTEDGCYGESEDIGKEEWVDWENKILEETVPLVAVARMILHSGRYEVGDRLSFEHEKILLESFLPYHPEYEKKIGCGVNYITIGYHPIYGKSRCLFLVREDGEYVDFSYWKCIKGLIRKKYPHYAETFILTHFDKSKRQ
ncbi:unnamed protein product [Cuscuta epithymum]|uniref:Uncharacterized protein n=1 Tax=Cuscuta epithymum TaxID=186058 RepID=A0AAV0CLP9_9ASTE|nr:unnamed protein product [Cuscuta epithymum]